MNWIWLRRSEMERAFAELKALVKEGFDKMTKGEQDIQTAIDGLKSVVGSEADKIDELVNALLEAPSDAEAEKLADQITAITAGIQAKMDSMTAKPSGTTSVPSDIPSSGQGNAAASVSGGAS